jgi:MSHA pilin protein MshD
MCTRERCHPRDQCGLTLVELIFFILIVSIALLGVLLLMNTTTARSSDPLVRKQVLAIGEALLEEVALMPFTYCDPDDANVTTATSVADCATLAEGLGPEPGETRTSSTTPFDNVNDYDGYATGPGGVSDINGVPINGLGGYAATVTVTPEALTGTGLPIASAASLRISVNVTGPGGEQVTLEGYRTRYGPRSP